MDTFPKKLFWWGIFRTKASQDIVVGSRGKGAANLGNSLIEFSLQSPGRGKPIHFLQDLSAQHSRTRKQGPCLGQGTHATCLLSRALHQNQPDVCENTPQHGRWSWWPAGVPKQSPASHSWKKGQGRSLNFYCVPGTAPDPSTSQPPFELPTCPKLSHVTRAGAMYWTSCLFSASLASLWNPCSRKTWRLILTLPMLCDRSGGTSVIWPGRLEQGP